MGTFNTTMGTPIFLGYVEDDQTGNPMMPQVAGTTTWSLATLALGTLTPSTTGQSATYTPGAVGTDTVDFKVVVGGATFSATATVVVSKAPQVLTSVQIVQIASPV